MGDGGSYCIPAIVPEKGHVIIGVSIFDQIFAKLCAGFPGGSRKESEEETKYETGEERVTRTHDSGQSLQQYTDPGIIIYTCTIVEDVPKVSQFFFLIIYCSK